MFTPVLAVTVCYCCYWCSVVSKQKMPKTPGVNPENTRGGPGIFGYYPHWTLGSSWVTGRPSLLLFSRPNVSYWLLGSHTCCSVVTVDTSNTVQLPTLTRSKLARQNGPKAAPDPTRGPSAAPSSAGRGARRSPRVGRAAQTRWESFPCPVSAATPPQIGPKVGW